MWDSNKNFGFMGGDSGHTIKSKDSLYGLNVGNTVSGSSTSTKAGALGLTTDPTKSGIVADLSGGLNMVIKF